MITNVWRHYKKERRKGSGMKYSQTSSARTLLTLKTQTQIFPYIYYTNSASIVRSLKGRTHVRKLFERKIVIISIPISLDMCFGYSKEPSH